MGFQSLNTLSCHPGFLALLFPQRFGGGDGVL
jgi:hypothetical protein